MPKPRALSSAQAKRTLAHRFVRLADNLRQLATKFGIRPYRVWLVWTQFTGTEVGMGKEVEKLRIEILPTPDVQSLDRVALSPSGAGVVRVGDVQLKEISGSLTRDQLLGKTYPARREDGDGPGEPIRFFYEIQEDGRGDDPAWRARFIPMSEPNRKADDVQWQIMLSRVDPDGRR